MKIGALGPVGTFSEEAAKKRFPKDTIHIFRSNMEIFEAVVRKIVDKGLVPVENMLGGSVGETLDNFYKNKVKICGEIVMPIHLCIASKSPRFKKIISHPMAIAECREYLRKHYPNCKLRERSSTAFAMSEASESETPVAAIGNELAAERYGLTILERNIEDNNGNVTRFLVIGSSDNLKPSKRSKTSISIYPHEDRPGLLAGILNVFADNRINLTKIESRPSGKKLGDYIFYIDFVGHRKEKHVAAVLNKLASDFKELKVYGSYDQANS